MTAFLILLVLGAVVYGVARTRGGRGQLADRVAHLERRVIELQEGIDHLRRSEEPMTEPRPERRPERAPAPPIRPRPAAPTPAYTRLTPERPPQPSPAPAARTFDWGRTVSLADLMGAKALALAGGVVTLLGVVFFFVLAVNRGWIGPEIRVACGGVASAIVLGAGLWLKHRYETTYSALAAVGTGLAGGYATLLAATSLYEMVSKPVALVVAAAIASVGVAVSLAWSAEIVAGFGLVGAMIVPATLVFQGGLQEIGTSFVAVVFAGAAAVAVRERWWTLLQVAALVSVPQALAQVAQADASDAGIVALGAVFWLLYAAAGLGFQLRLGPALAAAPASFLTGSAVFAGASAALLYGQRDDGVPQGIALLVVAAAYGVGAALLFRRDREPATLLWVLGLAAGAVGLAQALSGSSLTYAWAAEAAILVWLSSRVRDARFQLPAIAYLGLAVVHAIAFEAHPDHLFQAMRHPAGGAPALLAIALAAAVFARVDRSSTDDKPVQGVLKVLEPSLAWLRRNQAAVDMTALALAAIATFYAASLGILELLQLVWSGDAVHAPFAWGHVAVTATWSLAALLAVVAALRRRSEPGFWIPFGLLIVTVVKVLGFDARTLSPTQYGISFVIVGGAVLLATLARELTSTRGPTGEGSASVVVSIGLLLAGALTLIPDDVAGADGNGIAVLAVGALYTALGAVVLLRSTRRDFSTLLWALGLAVVAVADGLLLGGFWLVLAYTATAAALAGSSVAVDERRLVLASLGALALGAAFALVGEAPPSQLVLARPNPGAGVPSLLLVIGATAALAWAVRERDRLRAIWVAVALGVYAGSLGILEAAQRLSPEGVHTDFQRGQTAVSAFWGLLALVSLYLGLTKSRGLLRGGGFLLFGISLAKIFLFDLPSLSSAQRALSFLAVGAVLLLGGFFYQRLSTQFDERGAPGI